MKYRTIYKVIQDSSDTTMNDWSNWQNKKDFLIYTRV